MNRYLALIVVAICASSAPAKGQEVAKIPEFHLASISRDVAQWHNAQHSTCTYEKLIERQAARSDVDYSEEHWTISACGKQTFAYKVTIFFQKGGGLTSMVSNISGAPIGPAQGNAPLLTKTECDDIRAKFEARRNTDRADGEMSTADMAAHLADCSVTYAAP